MIIVFSLTGDTTGQACANDFDGDGIKNDQDVCPHNKFISNTDFRKHDIILLDPEGAAQSEPDWHFNDMVMSPWQCTY